MNDRSNGDDVKRTRRRRRSGGSSGRGLTTASSVLQHPAVSQVAPLVMGAAAVLYVVGSAGLIYHSSNTIGDLWRGLSKIDTRYIAGPPTREEGPRWIYDQGETSRTLVFNDRGEVDSIHCLTRGAASAACAPFLGIGINRTENEVWTALGAPDQQRYYGETKVITYNGMGVEFTLERYTVKGIARVPKRNVGLTAVQWLRTMFP